MTFDEGALRLSVAAVMPWLAGAELAPLARGFDCDAYSLGGQVIVKRPLHPGAAERLRREVGFLSLIAPRVSLPVPRPHLVMEPLLSWHVALPGERLLPDQYARLTESARQDLGQRLGRFLAELHAADMPDAPPVEAWSPVEEIAALSLARLPAELRDRARKVLADYAALPPDPLGEGFGHFDGHGWNMAFDHAAGRLNGVFDFGDSGRGPLHRDFIYAGLTGLDLMDRVVTGYERASGGQVDRARVWTLSGAHRLWELSKAGAGDEARLSRNFADWVGAAG